MKFVKANGLVIHYHDQGRRDGPPLVFINSLGTDFRIWNEVAEILAPDFRIITYDKRGHGLSESGPGSRTTWPTMRAISRRFWIKLGVGRATIVGLSIGGLIAQEFYRHHPDRVAALVLCDTAAKIGTDEVWDQRIAEVRARRHRSDRRFRPRTMVHRRFPHPVDPPSLPACAPCSRERRAKAISPLAAP